MGLRIERYPVISKPRRRMETVSVPGRSGDLHIDDGSWEDITLRYECWWKNGSAAYTTARTAHEVAQWLYLAPVGARLEDTYDSQVYRRATWEGGVDVENILNRYGRLTLEFRCDPRAFLKSAESALTFAASGGMLNNPTPFATKPLVRIVGSISGLLKIGNSSMLVRFQGMDTQELWVDCQEQEAWQVVDGAEVPCNAWIDGQEFLEVAPGANKIEFPSSFDEVQVWTRAYTV